MKSIESSAKSMEEAVTQGLDKLGVSLSDVTIDIIDEGSKGLFGILGGKPARVRLTLKDTAEENDLLSSLSLQCDIPASETKQAKQESQKTQDKAQSAKPAVSVKPVEKKQERPASAPARAQIPAKAASTVKPVPGAKPAANVIPADIDEIVEKAKSYLTDVTAMMNVTVSVEAKADEEGNVRVDMQGDTLGILIGRRGETLDALQYLTSLYVNRGREDYTRVTIDTENYRAKREEALTRLANRMANRAVKTGRKVVLEPMNPYERRILHSALQQNDAVTTHSEGEEPNRHVVITLK